MSLNPVALPEDLVPEILARLPAKSLLRFRCVSKQWKALIGSQYFVNLQLKISKARAQDNPQILLMINNNHGTRPSFLIVSPDSPPQKMRPTHLPFTELRSLVRRIHGCCNGLVCLSNSLTDHIVLWNPTIRKRWVLPVPVLDDACHHPPILTHSTIYSTYEYAFGYDDIGDDYKVVGILACFDSSSTSSPPRPIHQEVKVYSVASNSWRRLPLNFQYIVGTRGISRTEGKLVNNALHWKAIDDGGCDCIVALDLNAETTRIFAPPPNDVESVQSIWDVGVFEDFLCVIYMHSTKSASASLWIMKDYGLNDSWTKITVVEPHPNILQRMYGPFYKRLSCELNLIPYLGRRSNEIFFHDDINVYAYDTVTHLVRPTDLPITKDGRLFQPSGFPLITSLVEPWSRHVVPAM
ncbi:OLC1v1007429C1 [Oldenlandia corymbosa var. corymbosa]|uniref:OLC1v1007429C1 n=1 Tax=Oldenlandia corymbosa var. corymbosa TaxID=529605 RepID=A0AAV1DJU3_OLDCO|nr:OLC1v1007429C1 [Oldenlandia corymbosa var. corymbosa]